MARDCAVGLTGAALTQALARLVGQDVSIDSELMSPWTQRNITAAAANPVEARDQLRAFQVVAVDRLSRVSPGLVHLGVAPRQPQSLRPDFCHRPRGPYRRS